MKDRSTFAIIKNAFGELLFVWSLKSPRWLSVKIFNFWSGFKFEPASIRHRLINNKLFFIVRDVKNGNEWLQVSLRSCFISFLNGLSARSETLATQYAINNLDMSDFSIVLDCGANTGDFFLAVKSRSFNGQYLAYEPSETEFKALEINLSKQENVTLENKGLWHEDTILKFYVSEYGADSSFEEPVEYSKITEVETTTIDKTLEKFGINTGDKIFLKIEAEGCEPEVLRGAEKILKSCKAELFISVDLGFERGVSEKSTLPAVCNLMTKFGLEVISNAKHRQVILFHKAESSSANGSS